MQIIPHSLSKCLFQLILMRIYSVCFLITTHKKLSAKLKDVYKFIKKIIINFKTDSPQFFFKAVLKV